MLFICFINKSWKSVKKLRIKGCEVDWKNLEFLYVREKLMAECWKDFSFDYEFLLSENFVCFLLDKILLLENYSIYLLF